ncbi:MAG: hypothetical protein AAF938_07440, partial [Myxococcota bacterium]
MEAVPGGHVFAVVLVTDDEEPRVWPFDGETLRLDANGRPCTKAPLLELRWTGREARIVLGAGAFIAGKSAGSGAELKPGEDLRLGNLHIVVGVTGDLRSGGRRTLTHHEFRERVYEEIARARRSGRSTALVMTAARAGDGQAVARAALDTFRAGDLAATYAPDQPEFLLTDTDGETAKAVVERVFETAGVNACAGIAVAPHDGETAERLVRAARRALADAERARSEGENSFAFAPADRGTGLLEAVQKDLRPVAVDARTVEVLGRVHDLAEGDASVLLLGEASVGKSAYARLLHRDSGATGRFVARHGATFELAAGLEDVLVEAAAGVLFVEEVAELSLADQGVLADALPAMAGRIRLIASSEHAVGALAARGAFNTRLADELSAQVVTIPSLRERPDDILPLARSFVRSAQRMRFSAGAVARLRAYPWPGNVLELANAVERAVQ